jgi:Lar family restriction alleviation protein
MKETELKPCPFCGGEAEVKDCFVFLDKAVVIRCTSCFVRTKKILIDHPRLTADGLDESTRYTREQAIQKVADAWNSRAINAEKQIEGVWKFNKSGSGTCSECGMTQNNVWDYDGFQRFCGCCGAKMKGGDGK